MATHFVLTTAVIVKWVREIAERIFRGAKRKSTGGKSGSAQGAPKLTVSHKGTSSVIDASAFHFGRPALDSEIRVPIGGFAPPHGQTHWKFIKPEGTLVRVARTYSRFSGQIIKKKGFMTEATEEELTGLKGFSNVKELGDALAEAIAKGLVIKIVSELSARGIKATVVSS